MADQRAAGARPFLERDLELDLVLSLASEVAAGSSRIAVVTGESGVGKSRLCQEVADRLPGEWCRVVYHRVGPEPAPEGPALVVVEDLHDADPDTGDQIRTLLAGEAAVLVICTHRLGVADRSDSSRTAAFSLLRTPGVVEVHLSPLSEGATIELARQLGSDVDDEDALRLHERTGGNPFFIEELTRRADAPVPWTITASVMDRVEVLPDEARTAIEALAVAGRAVSRSVLDQVAGSARSVGPELVDRHLAITSGREIRLRHEIVGEVVAEGLAEHRVRSLHRDLADALLDQPSPPAHRVAHHLLAAGDQCAAATWALAAAREAVAQRRFARAVELFRIALDDGTAHPGDVLEQAAVTAAQAGRTRLAERWAHRAEAAYRAAGDPHRAAALWLDASLTYVRRPPIDLDELSPDAAARLAADADALARAGDIVDARDAAIRAANIAMEQDDSAAGGAAARALLLAGEPAEAVARLESLRVAAILADNPVDEARRSFDLARCASALGDQTAAEAHQRAGLAAMARVPESGERPLSQAGLAALLATSGRLAEAEAVAEPLLDDPNATVSTIAGLPLTTVDLACGRLDRARRWLAAIAPYRSIAGPDLFGVVLAQQALLHLRSGDLDRAASVLDDAEMWIGGRFDISKIDRLEVVDPRRGAAPRRHRARPAGRRGRAAGRGPRGRTRPARDRRPRHSGCGNRSGVPTPSPSPTSRRPPASWRRALDSSRPPMRGAMPRWPRSPPVIASRARAALEAADGDGPVPGSRARPGGRHPGPVGLDTGDRSGRRAAHTPGAIGDPPGGRRADQQGDRSRAAPVGQDGAQPAVPALRQARHRTPQPGRRLGGPPRAGRRAGAWGLTPPPPARNNQPTRPAGDPPAGDR